MPIQKEIIVLGGGCFWCTEAVFEELKGVLSVIPGYAGGITSSPTYEEVLTGLTGHAEVIRLEYDANIISLHTILTIFFATHDSTTLNRQGNDNGTQYRSIILYTTEEQKMEIKQFIKKLSFHNEITTEIKSLSIFYNAERYHHHYYKNHPEKAYCAIVINPKLEKIKKEYLKFISNEYA